MRTTLRLDDDLLARLKQLALRRGTSLRDVVNATVRRGLSAPEPGGKKRRRFRVKPFHSRFRAGVDPEKLNQLTDDLEVRRFGARS